MQEGWFWSLLGNETFWVALGSLATVLSAMAGFLALRANQRPRDYRQLEKVVQKKGSQTDIDQVVLAIVRRVVRRYFKHYSDFILLRYGSSVDVRARQPRDYDYLVLLLGYAEEDNRKEFLHGDAFVFDKYGIAIDVLYKDYASFLFATIAGMPYEHSALARSYMISGNEGYIKWLDRLRTNIQIDSQYVLEVLMDRIKTLNKEIEDDLVGSCDYATIMKLYSLASALAQVEAISAFPNPCTTHHMVAIADSDQVLAMLQEGDFKDAYRTLLRYFKREVLPGPNLKGEIRSLKARFIETAWRNDHERSPASQ